MADDQRASEVIQRLRRLLKKGEFQPEILDANEVIRDVLNLMRSELTARTVAVVAELAKVVGGKSARRRRDILLHAARVQS